ncbi:MAG: hypothetical protein AVDCRST_MAG19-4676, partial [uncultured Thermomicrobiales bacterium]
GPLRPQPVALHVSDPGAGLLAPLALRPGDAGARGRLRPAVPLARQRRAVDRHRQARRVRGGGVRRLRRRGGGDVPPLRPGVAGEPAAARTPRPAGRLYLRRCPGRHDGLALSAHRDRPLHRHGPLPSPDDPRRRPAGGAAGRLSRRPVDGLRLPGVVRQRFAVRPALEPDRRPGDRPRGRRPAASPRRIQAARGRRPPPRRLGDHAGRRRRGGGRDRWRHRSPPVPLEPPRALGGSGERPQRRGDDRAAAARPPRLATGPAPAGRPLARRRRADQVRRGTPDPARRRRPLAAGWGDGGVAGSGAARRGERGALGACRCRRLRPVLRSRRGSGQRRRPGRDRADVAGRGGHRSPERRDTGGRRPAVGDGRGGCHPRRWPRLAGAGPLAATGTSAAGRLRGALSLPAGRDLELPGLVRDLAGRPRRPPAVGLAGAAGGRLERRRTGRLRPLHLDLALVARRLWHHRGHRRPADDRPRPPPHPRRGNHRLCRSSVTADHSGRLRRAIVRPRRSV